MFSRVFLRLRAERFGLLASGGWLCTGTMSWHFIRCWILLFSFLDLSVFHIWSYKWIISEKKMWLKLRESMYLASISSVLGLCKICCSPLRHQDNVPIFSSSRQRPLSTSETWSIFFWKSHGAFEICDWEWFWKIGLGSLICSLKSFESTSFRKTNRNRSRRINSSVFLRKNNYYGSFKARKEPAVKPSPELSSVTADLAVIL